MRIRSHVTSSLFFKMGMVLACLSVSVLFARSVGAQHTIFKYNKTINYDIYIGTANGSTSVVKNIEIVRLEKIGDEMFLVVQVKGFQLNSSEGYIRLSAVQAILPSNYIKVFSL
ncbi:MAG: hypothetical protein K8S27_07775 [Candidatus Omnitrophica bacterium]|nr:hypothetical protein [Candidatus Omnitrophota bacterium]